MPPRSLLPKRERHFSSSCSQLFPSCLFPFACLPALFALGAQLRQTELVERESWERTGKERRSKSGTEVEHWKSRPSQPLGRERAAPLPTSSESATAGGRRRSQSQKQKKNALLFNWPLPSPPFAPSRRVSEAAPCVRARRKSARRDERTTKRGARIDDLFFGSIFF